MQRLKKSLPTGLLDGSFPVTQRLCLERAAAEGQFIEGWMRGTYIVAGIFAIPTDELGVRTIEANIPTLYEAKRAKRSWWPRGIAGTFLFPFYLGRSFTPEVESWVQQRRPYRWAIWHEPVLYDISRHSVAIRGDYGLFGSAFYPLVGALYNRAMQAISVRLGRQFPDFINGRPTGGRPTKPGATQSSKERSSNH